MTAPSVAIVIVNYNCADDAEVCLRSLANLDYRSFFVVVVENNSTDSGAARLGKLARELGCVFIRSPENRGFAGANNIGIQYARAAGAEYVWLLNPDTVVDRGALSAYVAAAAREPNAVFGGKVLYGDLDAAQALEQAKRGPQRGERIWSAGGRTDAQSQHVEMYGCGKPDDGSYDIERDCDYLPGCSMFLPLAAIERAGFMPEEFFMYFEETEWCSRLKECGYALKYLPASIVWHRFADEKMQGPRTVYYYNRNHLAFWYRRSSRAEKWTMLRRVFSKKLPELRRAEREAPDENLRRVFAAHQAACWDFIFGRMGRRDGF